MTKNLSFFLVCYLLAAFFISLRQSHHRHKQKPINIVTATDERFFPCLLNFIGSIHRVNFDDLNEISVFDLGLAQEQRQLLNTISKVKIYTIEMTHPELLKHFITRPDGKRARGWYAWKPVVIKQALDMFPDILYIDSGIIILRPLNNLCNYIRKNGYFFVDCGHSINRMTTQYVKEKFNLESPELQWLLSPFTFGISAGFQGLTHVLYESYILPMYKLSKNLQAFVDDGTTPQGFGTGREDQTLFSIYARLLNLHVFCIKGVNYLDFDGHSVRFEIGRDIAFCGLENISHAADFRKHIRYKTRTSFKPAQHKEIYE